MLCDYTYNNFFKKDIEKAKTTISNLVKVLKNENNTADNFFEKIKRFDVEKDILLLKSNSSKVVNGIIVMFTAFILQNILIPVFIAWIIAGFFKKIF